LPVLKGLVLDTLGCAVAASTLGDGCAQAASMVRSNAGTGEATILGYGERGSALNAAFVNGALAHALNFDALGGDGGHLGVAAVVTPLVMAERKGGVSGRDFLAAVAVAAEFTARLAGALSAAGVDANEKFLEGQLLSYFGAAAGAGRILGFTPERMHSALGLALMQSAGTRQVSFEGGEAKAIYGGFANQGAALAALLAEQGIDARCDVLEGRAGVFSLFYAGKYDRSRLEGEQFRCMDTLFKRWPTSGMLHPYISACLALHRDTSEIKSAHVTVTPDVQPWADPARKQPTNAATAANSLFFCVSRALSNGEVALADFTSAGLAQPGLEIECSVADQAAVEIVLRSGERRRAAVTPSEKQMSYEALAGKFRDCARHSARPVAAEEAIERIANLERERDVGFLPGLLGGTKMEHL
jgi:2-methylcitrate dehydratase PrpD